MQLDNKVEYHLHNFYQVILIYSYSRAAGSIFAFYFIVNQSTQSHSNTLFSSIFTNWKYIMSTWSHGALIVRVGSMLYNTLLGPSKDLIVTGGPDELFQCYYIEKHNDLCSSHSCTHLMICIMHLSMSSRRWERRGIGRVFDIFQKIAVKFPTPGQKCEVKYNWNSQPREMICGHGHENIQISLHPGQQDNSNALRPGISGSLSVKLVFLIVSSQNKISKKFSQVSDKGTFWFLLSANSVISHFGRTSCLNVFTNLNRLVGDNVDSMVNARIQGTECSNRSIHWTQQ